jgi:hypothetical protein
VPTHKRLISFGMHANLMITDWVAANEPCGQTGHYCACTSAAIEETGSAESSIDQVVRPYMETQGRVPGRGSDAKDEPGRHGARRGPEMWRATAVAALTEERDGGVTGC